MPFNPTCSALLKNIPKNFMYGFFRVKGRELVRREAERLKDQVRFFTLFFFGANSKEAPDSNYPILLLCSYKRKPKRGFVKSLETLTRKLKVKGVSREKPLLERVLRRRQLPLEMELRP